MAGLCPLEANSRLLSALEANSRFPREIKGLPRVLQHLMWDKRCPVGGQKFSFANGRGNIARPPCPTALPPPFPQAHQKSASAPRWGSAPKECKRTTFGRTGCQKFDGGESVRVPPVTTGYPYSTGHPYTTVHPYTIGHLVTSNLRANICALVVFTFVELSDCFGA